MKNRLLTGILNRKLYTLGIDVNASEKILGFEQFELYHPTEQRRTEIETKAHGPKGNRSSSHFDTRRPQKK